MSNTIPTPAEILAAIAHFEEIAPQVPERSTFGDPVRERVYTQIRVLKGADKWLDFDDVIEALDLSEDDDRDDFDAARQAHDWLDGDYDEEDGGGPFEASWDNLAGVIPKTIEELTTSIEESRKNRQT